MLIEVRGLPGSKNIFVSLNNLIRLSNINKFEENYFSISACADSNCPHTNDSVTEAFPIGHLFRLAEQKIARILQKRQGAENCHVPREKMNFEELLKPGLVHIFGRIIRHAADREVEWEAEYFFDDWQYEKFAVLLRVEENPWLFCLRKYSQVAPQWEDAILNRIDSEHDPLKSWLKTFKYDESTIQPMGRAGHVLIKNGFLRVAKGLELRDVANADLDMVISNLEGNKVKNVDVDTEAMTIRNVPVAYTRFADIILLCKKATSLNFAFSGVKSQEEAEAIWTMFRAATHCNKQPKNISVIFRDSVRSFWDIDWSFTNDEVTSGPGSIDVLSLFVPRKPQSQSGRRPLPNWSRLGSIATCELDDGSNESAVNEFGGIVARTVTKSIIINKVVSSQSDFGQVTNSLSVLSTRAIDVQINLTLIAKKDEDLQLITKTFDCDASLTEKVQEWVYDVEVRKFT